MIQTETTVKNEPAPPLDSTLADALDAVRRLASIRPGDDRVAFTLLDRIENAARVAILTYMDRGDEPLDESDIPF